MPSSSMPSAASRPRTFVFLLLVAVVGATGLFSTRTDPATILRAGVSSANRATNLVRPAWYGMRIVPGPVGFVPLTRAPNAPVVPALGGILVDVDTHAILWAQNAHDHLPPASTTKILTALVALANLNPKQRLTITASALDQAWDETKMGIKAGETWTVEELLTGMLLVSGNDAATAIAVDTVGTERFVAAMNAQVEALGLHDSHFTNTVGLQDPDHYSSAYDLAAISSAAVRNFSAFRDIVAMHSADIPATSGHPEFYLQSINGLLGMYPAAVGIKPGWTSDAGNCEVGMAVRDGHRLISVLLNAPFAFRQSRRLLDWGFVQEGLPSTLPTPSPSPSPHG